MPQSEFILGGDGSILVDGAHYAHGHLARGLFRETDPPTGLFMPAIRWISRNGKNLLVERPPQRLIIQFANDTRPGIFGYSEAERAEFIRSYVLQIPWTVWLFYGIPTPRVHIWARPRPITSSDDEIYLLPLPNQDATGAICWGTENPFQAGKNSIQATIAFYMNAFWTDGFNIDMGSPECFPTNTPVQLNYHWYEWLSYWESQSIEDVLAWEFHPGRMDPFLRDEPEWWHHLEELRRPATIQLVMDKYDNADLPPWSGSVQFLHHLCKVGMNP